MHRVFLLLLAASLVAAQNPDEPHSGTGLRNPFANDPQAAAAGGALFQVHCAPCHGPKGEGGSGPALSSGPYRSGDRDEDLYRTVMTGRDVMPEFRHILGEEDSWRVVTFIRSLAGIEAETISGDAEEGGKLFWGKGGCGQCHRVGLNGGSVGPSLTEIGLMRGAKYLRESIVNPDADAPRGYATITVVTREGKTIQGVRLGFDNFSAQLVDLQGNFHSYLKSEVKEITRSSKSLMPSYEKAFGESELNDLVAYLTGLGKGAK